LAKSELPPPLDFQPCVSEQIFDFVKVSRFSISQDEVWIPVSSIVVDDRDFDLLQLFFELSSETSVGLSLQTNVGLVEVIFVVVRHFEWLQFFFELSIQTNHDFVEVIFVFVRHFELFQLLFELSIQTNPDFVDVFDVDRHFGGLQLLFELSRQTCFRGFDLSDETFRSSGSHTGEHR
jgi:hypothetical protein